MLDSKRREFIALIGGGVLLLAAKVKRARGQQPAMPVIGFLHSGSANTFASELAAFRQGLKDGAYVEGQNVTIEYRWADGRFERLPDLAADLVRRNVSVIAATGGNVSTLAAKAATATIPIVFTVPEDPVRLGLVASLARPGGNATGINFFSGELAAKRLGLLRELVPAAARVALLIDPATMDSILEDAKTAARTMGLQIQVVHASTSGDIEAAFASFGRERPDALLVGGGAFLFSRRIQLALLAARYAVPASYGSREYPEIGGLMSYGTSLTDAYRQVGVYAGRVLKGAKAADLPVLQATKFELVINHPAAKALGLEVPPTLFARADEVIE
jgi:putative tryptophan/tyrosine transport system substrate-binding protein